MKKERYNYPRSSRNRAVRGPCNERTANIIAKNIERLKQITCEGVSLCCCGETEEDVFSDTILYVVQENNLEALSETEVLAHFCHRFKMIQFQTVRDSNYINQHLNTTRNGIHTQEEE